MAARDDLELIAQEGFHMVEDFYGHTAAQTAMTKKKEKHENTVQNSSYPKWKVSFAASNYTIDCKKAAEKYGGVVFVESQRKYQPHK